jgi:hypothetical protein
MESGISSLQSHAQLIDTVVADNPGSFQSFARLKIDPHRRRRDRDTQTPQTQWR